MLRSITAILIAAALCLATVANVALARQAQDAVRRPQSVRTGREYIEPYFGATRYRASIRENARDRRRDGHCESNEYVRNTRSGSYCIYCTERSHMRVVHPGTGIWVCMKCPLRTYYIRQRIEPYFWDYSCGYCSTGYKWLTYRGNKRCLRCLTGYSYDTRRSKCKRGSRVRRPERERRQTR